MEQDTGSGPACPFSTAELTPRALCSVLGSPVQEKYGLTAMSPAQDHRMKGLEHLSQEKQRELGLFGLQKARLGLWGIYTFVCINS